MSSAPQKLSFGEKFGYSLGDAATNFFFQSMILYQSKFYTDVMGITAATAGTIFLLVRLLDAVFDPMVGLMADRTQSRWGKFRPWVLFTALPFGLILWLAYTVPAFDGGAKIAYAAITYTLLMMVYSANNLPYSALNGVMTGDQGDRTSLATFRFVAAMGATLVVQGLTLPLVDKFGAGDVAKGWSTTFAIFGALAVVFYVIAFFASRERITPPPGQKSSIKQDIKDVFTCKPWLAMFLVTLFIFTTLALRGSSMYYYFTYYVDKVALLDFVKGVGFSGASATPGWSETIAGWFGFILAPDGHNTTSVGFSVFNMAGNIVTIIGVLLSKPLAVRFGKKAVFATGVALTTLITAAIFVVKPDQIGLLFVLSLLWPAAYGPTIPLLWAMIADVADYSEWKTGRRATGFVYAGIVFGLKAGLGLGGAIGGWLLSGYGYVPNQEQTPEALVGIHYCATLFSAVPFALAGLCMLFYPVAKAETKLMSKELAARREKVASA
jgi:glycoside/pentoside/hexuronide:cation symporter, GPH family